MEDRPDYVRIGELFYPLIKSDKEKTTPQIDLTGFITHAVAAFRQGGRIKNDEAKKFVYFGTGKRYHLALSLISANRKTKLTEISMIGESNNLVSVLSLLNGNLRAEFSEVYLERLENTLKQNLIRNRRGNTSQLGQLNVYLTPSPENQILIKQAEWQNPTRLSFSSNLVRTLENLLGADSIALLSNAGSIRINNFFYAEDDYNQELIQESSTITQPNAGIYSWNYQIKTANGSGLPEALLDSLNRWFDLIKNGFDQQSYSLLEVVEESNIKSEAPLPW
ncbi:hypothetical protein J4417_00565 [Candidatus Woesearchaeota archaeon]|nr:hypothetical protein [Candidatus Woesearchaeota archaeon]